MKRLGIFLLICTIFFAAFSMAGCDFGQENKTANGPAITYASDAELAALPVNETYPSWKTIRKAAVIEFEYGGTREKLAVSNEARLSEKPVIVYDCNSFPYRYEYFVIDSAGDACATIAVTARRGMTSFVITEVFPFVRDYSMLSYSEDSRLFAVDYPNDIRTGIFSGSGSRTVAETTYETNDPKNTLEQLSAFSDEELAGMENPDRAELTARIQEGIDLSEQRIIDFWNAIDSQAESLQKISDEAIIASAAAEKASSSARATVYTNNTYTLPTYHYGQGDADLTNTIWGGWCGPSALCNAYMGISQSYNGQYLGGGKRFNFLVNGTFMGSDAAWVRNNISPLDGGLYYDLADKTGCFFTGSWVLATSFDGAIKYVTGNQYGVNMTIYTPFDATNRLRDSNLPIIWWYGTHYSTVIGGSVQTYTFKWGILSWITSQSNALLIYDNGHLTSSHNYRPYYWKTTESGVYYYMYPLCKK